MILGTLLGRKGSGARRDTPDPRDYSIARLGLADASGDVDLSRPSECPIKDQGSTSSCVGQSLSSGIQLAYLVGNGEPCPVLSALDAYFGARELEGEAIRDAGCYPRLALKAVMAHGIATEESWPFGLLRVNRRPSWRARRDGYPRRGLRGYYSLSGPEQVALALRHRRPVQMSWTVTDGFQRLRAHQLVEAFPGKAVGGHAMLIVGVEAVAGALRFRIQNSWGTRWGNGGFWTASAAVIGAGHDGRALDV